ncbi:MAG: preprotein translocase subunit SecG [Firmicutes bacterium]|nr:preprotein translocase subunit SecG [Bacillota bacterium]HAL63816.1 preprotein translocase subunit SecG [Clostridiales bacterium]
MNTLFMVLHIIVTVALITVVLLQEGKDPGLKGIAGSTPDGDSFFNRNSGRTKASMFSKMTTTLAILFLITTVVLCVLNA